MALLKERITLLQKLRNYLDANNENLQEAVDLAERSNTWFTKDYIYLAINNIKDLFLDQQLLEKWTATYPSIVNSEVQNSKTVGIVMAGNIPLVGFHDFLCVYLSGHKALLKLSSKDSILWQHLLAQLFNWDKDLAEQVQVTEMLKNADAYIATGTNNTSRYFEHYFSKYPHIIRRNRTSVAVLDGTETKEELQLLSKDIYTYFGLGCRNVSQIYVPKGYDFRKLLPNLTIFPPHIEHHKYKNNFDYQLTLFLLNKIQYMSNDHILLVENKIPFAPIGTLHYTYYDENPSLLISQLAHNDEIQCIVSKHKDNSTCKGVHVYFGETQKPKLTDYADGIDTMQFLSQLHCENTSLRIKHQQITMKERE